MEVIKCPICGSEKCKEVSDDKYVCLACDNVFGVHNLSKEFKKTDQHLSEVHEDLKQTLKEGLGKNNEVQIKEKLENASKMMELGEYNLAYDKYREITIESPGLSEGWIGKYRALTDNYTSYYMYAELLCGGYGSDVREGEELCYFLGNSCVKNALACADCDEEKIKTEVYDFLKKCYERAQEQLVGVDIELDERYNEYVEDMNDRKKNVIIDAVLEIMKYLIPVTAIVAIVIFLIFTWTRDGGFLNIVLSVLTGIIGIKIFGRFLKWGVKNLKIWIKSYRSISGMYADEIIEIDKKQTYLFNMTKNYLILSSDISDKNAFMKKYLSEDYFLCFNKGKEEISDEDRSNIVESLIAMKEKIQTEEES